MIDPPPVTFSIATRIAEETKTKFLLPWQRCGGGVRFLRDGGRGSLVNDVVQGFHVDTRPGGMQQLWYTLVTAASSFLQLMEALKSLI
jgi:hypothetical protein